MALFKKNKNEKKEAQMNSELIRSLDQKPIRYVLKREPDGEVIIGRAGCINVMDDELSIVCNNVDVFRGKIDRIHAATLLSLEGIVLTYTEDSGETTAYVAYYKYYR